MALCVWVQQNLLINFLEIKKIAQPTDIGIRLSQKQRRTSVEWFSYQAFLAWPPTCLNSSGKISDLICRLNLVSTYTMLYIIHHRIILLSLETLQCVGLRTVL